MCDGPCERLATSDVSTFHTAAVASATTATAIACQRAVHFAPEEVFEAGDQASCAMASVKERHNLDEALNCFDQVPFSPTSAIIVTVRRDS